MRRQPWGVVVPILGARTATQLADNLGCLAVELSDDQLARLDRASRVELGFPTDFLLQVRQILYGNTYPLVDDHRR